MKIRQRLGKLLKMCILHFIISYVTGKLVFLYLIFAVLCVTVTSKKSSYETIKAIKYCSRYFIFTAEG